MKKIQLDRLTGAQLKALLEQSNPDGNINSLPEVLAFFQGVEDNETIVEYIQRIINNVITLPDASIGSVQLVNECVDETKLSPAVRDQLIGEALTEDDLENVFFPPSVSMIETVYENGHRRIIATAENIGNDEEVTWNFLFDNDVTPTVVNGYGTVLILDEDVADNYRAARTVRVWLTCYDYTSNTYEVKGQY